MGVLLSRQNSVKICKTIKKEIRKLYLEDVKQISADWLSDSTKTNTVLLVGKTETHPDLHCVINKKNVQEEAVPATSGSRGDGWKFKNI